MQSARLHVAPNAHSESRVERSGALSSNTNQAEREGENSSDQPALSESDSAGNQAQFGE